MVPALHSGSQEGECIVTQFASTLYPQTNPTNPILLELRDHLSSKKTPATYAACLRTWMRWSEDPNASSEDPIPWSTSQRSHALRVIERLERFSG